MSDGVDPVIYKKLRVPVGKKGMARVIPISQS